MSTIETANPILIDIPMPIETPRLIIRNVLPGDGKVMFEAAEESRAELVPWMPWISGVKVEADSERAAQANHAKFLTYEDMMMIGFCKETGKMIVSTGLHNPNWDLMNFDMGYYVRTPYTNKGYASETANALTRFAFGALGANKVSISHAEGNHASARVIEKLGFEKEGIFRRDARRPDGTITDHHWYARFDTNGLPDLDVRWGRKK